MSYFSDFIIRGGDTYTDRGDVSSVDFDQGDLTLNENWHDLDLSSIIPAGTKSVNLLIQINWGSTGRALVLRKNGNTNAKNVMRCWQQVASSAITYHGIVSVDENRKIEYWGHASPISIEITILSWFI